MNVLIIAEHNNQTLSHSTRHAVSAGLELGNVSLLVAGKQCDEVIAEAQKLNGIQRVLTVQAEHYSSQLPEELTPLIVSLQDQFDYFVAAASVFGKNLMPRVAAVLGVPQISDVIKIIDHNTFEHPVYAGNVIETITTTAEKFVLTIRSTAFPSTDDGDGNAEIMEVAATNAVNLTQFIAANLTQSDRPTLDQAKIIVSGGRALQNKDKFNTFILPLADKLNAAIGASRAAVDAGFISNDFQVGQTGKIVAPDLYIALGISGAIQHVAGMQGSKVVVAINNDPDAQIFKVADYGLVGDIFEVIPVLTEKL